MCTAATYLTKDFYFGRTLDYELSYGEQVTVTPRSYPFAFRFQKTLHRHHALIGMACMAEGYPLYFDAVNEAGLGMAGLNFPGNAFYREPDPDRENVAQFELIPWILGQCASVREALPLLERINITNTPFSEKLPVSPLHWILADKKEAITLESVREGLKIYPNPVGILTNNPPFPQQLFHLNNYMNLSPRNPENHFSGQLPLEAYSRGMGGLGLPGDLSSQSRFVRASFVKINSLSGDSESESLSQFFHILGSVDQPRGCCELDNGKHEITIYTSCCNADKGIYYYTTYENHQITAVDMHLENLEDSQPVCYPLLSAQQILLQNPKGREA